MAALPPIGAAATIEGLSAFLGGMEEINNVFLGLGSATEKYNEHLKGSTAALELFNGAQAALQKTLQTAATAFTTVTAPIRVMGEVAKTVFSEISQVVAETSSRILDSVAQIGVAAAQVALLEGAGLVGFFGALVSAGGAAIAIATKFHQELTDLGAVAQATPEQVEQVSEAVKRMATQFAIAIPQIQTAALELTKAGIAPEAVAAGVLKIDLSLQQLAKGELTAEGAAQGIASTLQLFKKSFEDAGNTSEQASLRIANAVTAAANATRATIPEVLQALTKAGPGFAIMGQDIEDAAASLTLLFAAGLRGEEAGTSLRNFFLRLENPSKEAKSAMDQYRISLFDAQGATRPYRDVLNDLANTFGENARKEKGLTDQQALSTLATIFQTRAQTGVTLAILQGIDAYDTYRTAISKTDVIRQAAQQMETLSRQLILVKNNVELAAIAFGSPFIQPLTDATKALNDFLSTGERAQQIAGLIGRTVGTLATGQGEDQTRAAIHDSPFADQLPVFDTLNEQAGKLRAVIETVGTSAGNLRDVLLQIIFPDGPNELIVRFSTLLEEAGLGVSKFLDFLTNIAPVAAPAFGQLIKDALDFAGSLNEIIGKGDTLGTIAGVFESVQGAVQNLRGPVGELIKDIAQLFRTVIENRDAILSVLTTVANGFILMTEVILKAASATGTFLGFLGKVKEFDLATFQAANGDVTGGIERMRNLLSGSSDTKSGFQEEIDKLIADLHTLKTSVDTLPDVKFTLPKPEDGAGTGTPTGAPAPGGGGSTPGPTQPDPKAIEAAQKRITDAARSAEIEISKALRTEADTAEATKQRFIDALDQIGQRFEDTTNRAHEQAERQRQDAIDAFGTNQEREAQRVDLQDTLEQRRTDLARFFDRLNTANAQNEEDQTRIIGRGNEDKSRLFTEGQEDIARIRQRGIEDADRDFQISQENALTAIQRQQDAVSTALNRSFDTTETARHRSRDDAERQADFAKQLAAAKTPEDRSKLQKQFADETTNLQRRRKDEDEDHQISVRHEEALKQFRFTQEDALTKFRRDQEDALTSRRRGQTLDDVQFRELAEADLIRFRRNLEDAETSRRRTQESIDFVTRAQQEDFLTSVRKDDAFQQRQQAFTFGLEDLQKQLGNIDTEEAKTINGAVEQLIRDTAGAGKTASREMTAALRQAQERLTDIQERFGSSTTSIIEGQKPENSPAVQSAIQQAQAVLAAQGAIASGQAQANADAVRTALGGIPTTAEEVIDLAAARAKATLEGTTVQTAVLISPQFDRLVAAIERNSDLLQGRGTSGTGQQAGVQIGNLNVSAVGSPEEVGPAIEKSLETVGGL